MSKPHFRLRLVKEDRPLRPLSRAEKLESAIAFLRERRIYVLDKGSPAKFGIPYSAQEESPLMKAVMEADRRRK